MSPKPQEHHLISISSKLLKYYNDIMNCTSPWSNSVFFNNSYDSVSSRNDTFASIPENSDSFHVLNQGQSVNDSENLTNHNMNLNDFIMLNISDINIRKLNANDFNLSNINILTNSIINAILNCTIYTSENATSSSSRKNLERIIVPVLFSVMFVIGMIGNGTLIWLFVRNRNLRSQPNTYIISLALGDVLLLCLSLPFVGSIFIFESWPYGSVICKFSESVRDFSVGVTVFTLTALSADRYMAIAAPMKRRLNRKGPSTLAIVIFIWILSLIFSTPAAITTEVVNPFPNSSDERVYCYAFPAGLPKWYPKVNIITKALVFYAIPLAIISTFYLLMARKLWRSTEFALSGTSQAGHQQPIEARKKVAKLVMCFVVVFILCFLPNHLFLVWFYFDPLSHQRYNHFWNAFRLIGFSLCFFNSCINPIVLYCISGTFRTKFNDVFCCRKSFTSPKNSVINYHGNYLNRKITSTMPTNSTIVSNHNENDGI